MVAAVHTFNQAWHRGKPRFRRSFVETPPPETRREQGCDGSFLVRFELVRFELVRFELVHFE